MVMEPKILQEHGELAKEQIIENNNTQLISNYVEPSRQKAIKKKNKRIEKNMKRYQSLKKSSGESSAIPMDLIIRDILIRIPPEALLQNFRYVCHEWLNLISTQAFAQRNLPYSRPKFILLTTRYHLRSQESKFEIFDMKEDELVRDSSMGMWKGQARNSCRGLILVADENKKLNHLHVFNPITMKLTITLPQCPSSCPHEDCTAWLAFDSSKNVFKVVHMYADQFGYEIWSLGIDTKWRVVPGPFEDMYDDRPFSPGDFNWGDPIAVNDKVLHWNVNQAHKYIISMDVTDELARKTSIPVYGNRKSYELFEMGGYLGIMFIVSNGQEEVSDSQEIVSVSDSQKDIWILKDFQSKKWIKIHSIISSSIQSSIRLRPRPQLCNLIPVLSLSNGGVILFKSSKRDVLYTYELKSSTLKMLNINFTENRKLIIHVNSLISCEESQDQLSRLFQPCKIC